MTSPLDGTVDLLDGMAFRATSGSGHDITLDASPDVGGTGRGSTPMELLLLGLGGCTGMDVISLLRKMRQEVISYRVELHADRAADHPKVMTAITVEHVVTGRELRPDAVRRAIELSATRYCSASAMLGAVAKITHSFQLIDAATGAEERGTLLPPHDG